MATNHSYRSAELQLLNLKADTNMGGEGEGVDSTAVLVEHASQLRCPFVVATETAARNVSISTLLYHSKALFHSRKPLLALPGPWLLQELLCQVLPGKNNSSLSPPPHFGLLISKKPSPHFSEAFTRPMKCLFCCFLKFVRHQAAVNSSVLERLGASSTKPVRQENAASSYSTQSGYYSGN